MPFPLSTLLSEASASLDAKYMQKYMSWVGGTMEGKEPSGLLLPHRLGLP